MNKPDSDSQDTIPMDAEPFTSGPVFEQVKEVYLQIQDALSRGDLDLLKGLISEKYFIWRGTGPSEEWRDFQWLENDQLAAYLLFYAAPGRMYHSEVSFDRMVASPMGGVIAFVRETGHIIGRDQNNEIQGIAWKDSDNAVFFVKSREGWKNVGMCKGSQAYVGSGISDELVSQYERAYPVD